MTKAIAPVHTPTAEPVASPRRAATDQPSGPTAPPFREVLQKELSRGAPLRFSAHALGRLEGRRINLTPEDHARLASAVDKAAQKGAKESLVLLGDLAFIVSVHHRTVITAMDGESIRENVFTHIDSAVVL